MSYPKNLWLILVLCLQPLQNCTAEPKNNSTERNPLKWITGGVAFVSGICAVALHRECKRGASELATKNEDLEENYRSFIRKHDPRVNITTANTKTLRQKAHQIARINENCATKEELEVSKKEFIKSRNRHSEEARKKRQEYENLKKQAEDFADSSSATPEDIAKGEEFAQNMTQLRNCYNNIDRVVREKEIDLNTCERLLKKPYSEQLAGDYEKLQDHQGKVSDSYFLHGCHRLLFRASSTLCAASTAAFCWLNRPWGK